MNPAHVWLVIAQEFRIRLRTGRWRWLLGIWVALLAGFTFLLDAGLETGFGVDRDDSMRGVPIFGFLMFFVLGSMLVISPALTSQTVNGDRERGTLATLQVTRLRPAEIATGKLLAGWSVGLVALALSVPFAGYAASQGGILADRMLAVYGVVALLIGTVCAFSQALSSLLARSITSALLSYVVSAALVFGTIIAFFLVTQVAAERRVIYNEWGSYETDVLHTERTWWLLAPNPFVILADAAPRVPRRIAGEFGDRYEDYDPLSAIGNSVRQLRMPPDYTTNFAYSNELEYYGEDGEVIAPPEDRPVWPYGVAFSVLLGAASLAVTTVRLRTPVRSLARGVRVA
jgi:ABC-type transport system involved in multi-copper enzyme maturation permease subunit